MVKNRMIPVWCTLLLLTLGGCAQLDAWTDTSGKYRADSADAADAQTPASTRYVNAGAPAYVTAFRNIYIAPANLANMQVIQPEGAPADAEWWITEQEDTVLQRTIAVEYAVALTSQSDFTVVTDRQQAQFVINTAVVAVHPDATRASVAKDGTTGGSITVSVAVVDAATGAVMVRVVGTRSSEDIWAFNSVSNEAPALNQVFAAWGADIRTGLMQLQGRSSQPATTQY